MTDMPDFIENCAGQTFRIGDRVRNNDGWTGTITAIKFRTRECDLLIVEPDNIADLPRRDCWPLNPVAAAHSGKTHFVRPRDHGRTTGNYTVIGSEVLA